MIKPKKASWDVCAKCNALFDTRDYPDEKHGCNDRNGPVFDTKTSGVDEVASTGATRDSREGKGRFDLIPALPLRRLAQVYERGGKNRGDRNWEKGLPLSRFIDSALRHIVDYQEGKRDEDHLIQAAWNLFGHVWTENEIKQCRLPKDLKK